ncbi:MAG TPA: sulfotransferase domain-containing protein [Terriglobales bacterium]|nr:sulfotransferase domain-containing protein [Terriglobales bacterium]
MTEGNNGGGKPSQDANPGRKAKKPTSAYRKLRRKFAQTALRAPLVWLRHRNLEPTDMFFAAYPKSGTTWARFVLYEILSGKSSGFKATNQQMPGIGLHAKALRLLPGGGRLIATHEYYRNDYKRAIYMVRDARDVLLSEFAFLSALEFYGEDLAQFVPYFLFTCVSAYGPWHKNVTSWLDSPIAGTSNMLLVRYEDLRRDPLPWFARMADFLGAPVDEEKIRIAVENNSIQNMRAKEDKEPVRASIKGRFVRDGKVRGWVSKLTAEQVRLIDQHAGETLVRLGYPLASELKAEVEANPAPVREVSDAAVRV